MTRSLKYLAILFMVIAAVTIPNIHAHADVAPPQQPPGSSLQPGQESTRVRMLSETVLIDVLSSAPEGSPASALVSAHFEMQNQSEAAESMVVRFPISVNDGFFNYPEVANFKVRVNGIEVPVRKQVIPDDYDDPLTWAEFDVNFPPGETVLIDVSYQLDGTGYPPFTSFTYLLETGAGWAGSIGDGEIIVRLPYEADHHNVIIDEQTGWSLTTSDAEIEGKEIRWQFSDLEPGHEHNIQISLVLPSVWAGVLRERDNVTRDPEDGEAWGRLGKAYKEIINLGKILRRDPGGVELYELSKQAYQKAVDLLPDDAWWHAGYAQLLWMRVHDPVHPGDLDEIIHTLRELDQTLQLDQDNELALRILINLSYIYPEAVAETETGYDFLWLTATPGWTAVPEPTGTPAPSETPTILAPTSTDPPPPTDTPFSEAETEPAEPTAEADIEGKSTTEETEASDEEGGFIFPTCGAALLVPLAPLALLVYRKR